MVKTEKEICENAWNLFIKDLTNISFQEAWELANKQQTISLLDRLKLIGREHKKI